MAASGIHISLKPDVLGHIGPLPVTNTLITTLLVSLFLIIIALCVKKTRYDLKSKWYNFMEMVMEGFMGLIQSVIPERKIMKQIFSVVVTFFLFIIINNWFGLFPGMGAALEFHASENNQTHVVMPAHAPENTVPFEDTRTDSHAVENEHVETHSETVPSTETAHAEESHATAKHIFRAAHSDLNMTLALALFAVLFIQVISIKNIGVKSYLGKFFNFTNPIMAFVGILELISEFVKIFSFSFRLFGNVFAGEVLITVIYFLALFLIPVPFMGIELFAGFIQALIFTMLTLVFIKSGVEHGEHAEHSHH